MPLNLFIHLRMRSVAYKNRLLTPRFSFLALNATRSEMARSIAAIHVILLTALYTSQKVKLAASFDFLSDSAGM